ncbi:MAG: metallophosphoesterase [Sulfobacillus sp.]
MLSDLHLEFYPHVKNLWRLLESRLPKADVLVLAGDIGYPINARGKPSCAYRELLQNFAVAFPQVVLVSGNHEYYRRCGLSLDAVDEVIAGICQSIGKHVHYLQQSVVEISGVRFLGCTGWTDPSASAFASMNDHLVFGNDGATSCARLHRMHYDWLRLSLLPEEKPSSEGDLRSELPIKLRKTTTIVVTHHLPTNDLVHPRFRHCDNTGYASEQASFFGQFVDYWLCGHTHEASRTFKSGIVCRTNPYGYPGEKRDTVVDWEAFELKQ